MSYARSADFAYADAGLATAPTNNFNRSERLVVMLGASASGGIAGFAWALSVGHVDWLLAVFIAAPFFAASFHFTRETLYDALIYKSVGCATAATMHAAALLAWPITALFAPLNPQIFWGAPIASLTALALLSLCWRGAQKTVYRIGAISALVAMMASQQGAVLMLGV